jgi:hypothetical protein
VLDAVLLADTVKNVGAKVAPCRPVSVLWQVGEGHAVVGQDSVDGVREHLDHLAQEGSAVQLGVGVEEGDVDELGHAVDRQEHEELARGQAQLADIDVDVADRSLGKALALGRLLLIPWQSGDAVPLEAAVQGAAGQPGDGLAQAAQDIIERQEGPAPELDDDRLLDLAQHAAARPAWPHRLIGGRGALAPLGHRLRVQPVAGGQAAGRLLRRLELGSNSRRRSG